MQKYRYLVNVLEKETLQTNTYRINTTLAGVETRFNKNFDPEKYIITDVVYDKDQN